MKILSLFVIVAFAIIGFNSCEKEGIDAEKPIITLISPTGHTELLIGDEHGIHLDMELSDNIGLSSYKINIHSNFDGHSHAHAPQKVNAASVANDSVPFEYTKIWTNIENQKTAYIHHHEIIIPKEINGKPIKEGDYHFVVYCLDKAGNESFVAVEVELSYTASDHDHHTP